MLEGFDGADPLALDYTPEETTTALIAIVAPRGGGKTTLMAALAPHLGPRDRLTIVSPVNVIGKKLGLRVETRYGADKDNEAYFSKLLSGRRVVLIMDEFDEFCPSSVQSKFGGYCCDALYRLVNYARNEPWCIGMLVSFRGASDVTTNLLRAATVLFIGRTQEPNALDYFSRYLGREYGGMLRNLPNFVFVVWADGRLRGYIRVDGGEVLWVNPPPGWPTPDSALSAGDGLPSTAGSAPPTESDPTPGTSAIPASESSVPTP